MFILALDFKHSKWMSPFQCELLDWTGQPILQSTNMHINKSFNMYLMILRYCFMNKIWFFGLFLKNRLCNKYTIYVLNNRKKYKIYLKKPQKQDLKLKAILAELFSIFLASTNTFFIFDNLHLLFLSCKSYLVLVHHLFKS